MSNTITYEMTTNACYSNINDRSTTNAAIAADKSQKICNKLAAVLVVGLCVNMLLTVCGLALAILAMVNQRNDLSFRLEGLQLEKSANDFNSTQLQVRQLMDNVGALFTAQSDINKLVSGINRTGASPGPPGRKAQANHFRSVLRVDIMKQWVLWSGTLS